eukprot:446500-Prymnesium_polylepis.1
MNSSGCSVWTSSSGCASTVRPVGTLPLEWRDCQPNGRHPFSNRPGRSTWRAETRLGWTGRPPHPVLRKAPASARLVAAFVHLLRDTCRRQPLWMASGAGYPIQVLARPGA